MAEDAYDAIVVLGTRVFPDGRPSAALKRRTAHGVALLGAGKGRNLILSGGVIGGRPAEAEIMRRLAAAGGAPSDRLVVEDASTSTFTNATRTASILRQRGWRRVLVVTDRYHLARALFVFRKLGVEADGSAARAGRGGRRRHKAALRVREAAVWAWYLLRVLVFERRRIRAMRREFLG